MRTKGYITFALNTCDDYVKCAYCLALSIKVTQTEVRNISVVVERSSLFPDKYKEVFDQVIELPCDDLAIGSRWKVENYYQAYAASPYEETITLDADTIFVTDISSWWNKLATRELVASNRILNYRGNRITHNTFREEFYRVCLPDFHNGFLYFRKTQFAKEVFGRIEHIAKNWDETSARVFGRRVHYSSDSALNIALRDMGAIDACAFDENGFSPEFVHMKSALQGFHDPISKDWRRHVSHSFDKRMGLSVGGYPILHPFHYHIRSFADDELIDKYEKYLASFDEG